MTDPTPSSRKSGLLEISIDEPKGTLGILLKAAKKEEKIILSDIHTASKKITISERLVKEYANDIFGKSYGVKRPKKFKRLVNESLKLTLNIKIHLPVIEAVAKEVEEWLQSHKKDKITAEILPAHKKIIDEVRKTESILETAVKHLTELDNMQWGSTSSGFSFFGMYYLPVERESEKMTGIKFRSDWILHLKKSIDALERIKKAVENIFELQKEINLKYRV